MLADSGVAAYGKETVHAGDAVRIRGSWVLVDKANPKTVSVTTYGLQLKYPYTEIQGHREVSDEGLLKIMCARQPRDLRDSLRSPGLTPKVRAAIEAALAKLDDA